MRYKPTPMRYKPTPTPTLCYPYPYPYPKPTPNLVPIVQHVPVGIDSAAALFRGRGIGVRG